MEIEEKEVMCAGCWEFLPRREANKIGRLFVHKDPVCRRKLIDGFDKNQIIIVPMDDD